MPDKQQTDYLGATVKQFLSEAAAAQEKMRAAQTGILQDLIRQASIEYVNPTLKSQYDKTQRTQP